VEVAAGFEAAGEQGHEGRLDQAALLVPGLVPGVDLASVAFLTPENIAAVAGLRQRQEHLKQEAFKDLVDSMYKGEQLGLHKRTTDIEERYKNKLIEQIEANLKAKAGIGAGVGAGIKPLDQPFLGKLTLRQFNALPESAREYLLAKKGAEVLGDTDFMTKREWEEIKPNERVKFLEELSKRPELVELQERLSKAGAPVNVIENAVNKELALSEIEGQKYFNKPGWADDVNKYLASEEVQDKIFTSKEPDKTKAIETVGYIESKIKAGGGEIVNVKWDDDGKTMVWTVKWPSGNTSTIRRAVK